MRKADPNLFTKRREQIIDMSVSLFASKNYHEVKMEDVAGHCGLAKGSVYNYFKTKEDLYISIISCRLQALLSILKNRIDHKQTPLTNLRRIIVHIYGFMTKYPHFFQIWYREKINCQRMTHQEISQTFQEIRNLMISALQKGTEVQILKSHDSPFIADAILGMIDAAVIRSKNLTAEKKQTDRLRIFEFLLNALGTDKALQMHQAGLDAPGEAEEWEAADVS